MAPKKKKPSKRATTEEIVAESEMAPMDPALGQADSEGDTNVTIVSLASDDLDSIPDAQLLRLLLQREGLASLLLEQMKSLGFKESPAMNLSSPKGKPATPEMTEEPPKQQSSLDVPETNVAVQVCPASAPTEPVVTVTEGGVSSESPIPVRPSVWKDFDVDKL